MERKAWLVRRRSRDVGASAPNSRDGYRGSGRNGLVRGISRGNPFDPVLLWKISDGASTRAANRIAADGMTVTGSGNVIATFFRNASGPGKANLRLRRGSSRNLAQSQFQEALDGAVDLIIEPDCRDNVIRVVPAMTIVDHGVNTRYIGAEWAGRIERNAQIPSGQHEG